MLQRWAAGARQSATRRPGRSSSGAAAGAHRAAEPGRAPAATPAGACGTSPSLLDLPPRLSLFGLTRLPASYLDVLEAIGRGTRRPPLPVAPVARAVGPAGGADRAGVAVRAPRATTRRPRAARNPLLASWGRDAREMQLVLGAAVGRTATRITHPATTRSADAAAPHPRRHPARPRAPAADAGRTTSPTALEAGDDSIRVHSCHGRGRQVEVLRDAVLHLLEDDPTLEPRDIIVHVPRHRELRTAHSGDVRRPRPETTRRHDPRRTLEIRLADRSLRQTNPVMGVLAEVLDLATARITATEVLDLAGREPVRRRFHFSDDDLFRLEEWVESACVRWGFDAEHRAAFKLDGIDANTWQAGLDRILLGVAMADERQRLFGGALPLDDVDSADIELAGRLAEFLHRLRIRRSIAAGTRTVDGLGRDPGDASPTR